ncbi:MAG: glycoside hydrolase family 127 protein [Treponema sp.]|nr:glycoside hydrolase family 127 protein [Treponema sp.]
MPYTIKTISLDKTSVTDDFWNKRMEIVRTQMIPYQWKALNDQIPGAEPSWCIRNFRLAAQIASGRAQGSVEHSEHKGFVFQDSDLYKWLEAVAYTLAWHHDSELEALADSAIDLIASAQMNDGYLDTFYILNGIEKRFTNLKDNHELYCLGHMVESAVAYYEVTGKNKFLTMARRFTDCAMSHIGAEEGKLHGYPGHPILEMALMRLYAATAERQYLNFASYLINQRGQKPLFFAEETVRCGNKDWWGGSYLGYRYYQADVPLREQTVAEGHAVRALYLYSGMADVARETEDDSLVRSCMALYRNVTSRQMYITGNVGQCAFGESFTLDYDLPNALVYGETCAQIALVFLSQRMLRFGLNGTVADVMERVLYNGVLSGASLDGKSFFYVNPLEVVPELTKKAQPYVHVKAERQKWFSCACCPPNFARLVSSIGSYVHTVDDAKNLVATHLFIAGRTEFNLGGSAVFIDMESSFPWKGHVKITFHMEKAVTFTYAVRNPSYVHSFALRLNGQECAAEKKDGYLLMHRTFKDGDELEYEMDLQVRVVFANPKVRENIGKAAVMMGPVVYCLEEHDNGKDLHQLRFVGHPDFYVRYEPDLLNGVNVITCKGFRLCTDDWGEDELYSFEHQLKIKDVPLTFIPYYAWNNRGPGEMMVWVHRNP